MRKKAFSLLIYLLGLLLIFHLSKNLWDLYLASQRIRKEEERLVSLVKENEELRKKLRYLQSEEFVEREARDKLGLVKEGETVVIGEEILGKSSTNGTGSTSREGEESLPVWREWVRLFWKGEEE